MDTPTLGCLEIIRKDGYEEIYLSGAGFRVFDSEGTQVAEGYTDGFGRLRFNELPFGSYTYQEFKAPQGFELDEMVYSVEVSEDHPAVSQIRTSGRRTGTIVVWKRDENGKPIEGLAFLLEFSTDKGSTWLPVFPREETEANIIRGGCTSSGLSDGRLVADNSGKVCFTGLRADCLILYRLTGGSGPEGYTPISGALFVGTLPIRTENIYASDAEVFGTYAYRYTQCLTEDNDPVFRLPETGGSGFAYLPFAMLLCAASITIITKKSKKGDYTV